MRALPAHCRDTLATLGVGPGGAASGTFAAAAAITAAGSGVPIPGGGGGPAAGGAGQGGLAAARGALGLSGGPQQGKAARAEERAREAGQASGARVGHNWMALTAAAEWQRLVAMKAA